ncbi:MAG: DUF190 domain-containing protein [bacterium]
MKRLRIYFKEGDKIEGKNFCRFLAELIQETGISGATLFKSIYSYGGSKVISNINIEAEMYKMGQHADIIDDDGKIEILVEKFKGGGFLMGISNIERIYP